jgi:hypothetical protein
MVIAEERQYRVCPQAEWSALAEAHELRVQPLTAPYRLRQQRGEKHPVHDFLFSYYAFRAAHLERWSPGAGIILEGRAAEKFLRYRSFTPSKNGVWLDPAHFPAAREEGLRWTIRLLEATERRLPQFRCYGLHEWAMVYRETQVRHSEVPLRMSPQELGAFVESQSLCCSHFDAFRFFTPAARPLNRWTLTRETQPEAEQPGCLHATMDLYKWSMKLAPWLPAELAADCFVLAQAVREADMRASPYDLREFGYAPIMIETASGRATYEAAQRDFTEQARPLRARLLEGLRALLKRRPKAD